MELSPCTPKAVNKVFIPHLPMPILAVIHLELPFLPSIHKPAFALDLTSGVKFSTISVEFTVLPPAYPEAST